MERNHPYIMKTNPSQRRRSKNAVQKLVVPARQKHAGGRPSKMTSAVIEELIECMSLGLSNDEACQAAGISPSTMYGWIQKNDPETQGFLEDIKKGKARRLKFRLQQIEAGAKNWQSLCWLLERDMPNRFARPEILLELNRPAEAKIEEKHASTINVDVIIEQAGKNPAIFTAIESMYQKAKANRDAHIKMQLPPARIEAPPANNAPSTHD